MYKIAIQRPITTIMFALSLLFFGFVELDKMAASLYPDVDFPTVVVTTFYKGASADIVESKVSDKIEEAISGISNLEFVSSDSSKGVSVVIAQFELDKPVEEAVNDVRDKVSSLILPIEVDKPKIEKFSISAMPVITLFVSSKDEDKQALMLYSDEILKPQLQKLRGVGDVNLVGFRKKTIKIYPDLKALAKHQIDLNQLSSRIKQENIKIDAGRIVDKEHEWSITIEADSQNLQELENIKIKDGIRLVDLATIDDAIEDERSYANLNGKMGIMMQIKKLSNANEIEIASLVKNELTKLQALSDEFEIELLFDTTTFIDNTLENVKFDLLLGCFLASLVVFVFLRNITLTIVSALALPISIFGILALLGWANQSLNLMTLTALTLAIGIIVDDAIVVIENIYKRLEAGESRYQASLNGVKEISFSILAISAMLLAVFIPIANMSGVVGKFFTSFGLSVAGAVVISYIVAITFIPMISSLLVSHKESLFYKKTEFIFASMEKSYKKLLFLAVNYKITTLILSIIVFMLSLVLSSTLGMNFIPKEDKSQFDISIKTNPGISMQEMKKRVFEIQDITSSFDEVLYSSMLIGSDKQKKIHESSMTVKLKPLDQRSKSQADIMNDLRSKLAYIDDMTINITEPADIGTGEINTPFLINLKSQSSQDAKNSALKLEEFLQTIDGTHSIQNNIQPHAPEISIQIQRDKSSRLGIDAYSVSELISNAFLGEIAITYLRVDGKEYDIVMSLKDEEKQDIKTLSKLMIQNSDGELIYLSSIANISYGSLPTTIKRRDRQQVVLVGSDLNSNLSLDTLVEVVKSNSNKWLIDGVSYELDGDAKYMQESNEAFGIAIFAAAIMIYLILASLYESPIQPIIIMSALPLSFSGAFIGLYIFDMNNSLFSLMGLMLLMGLVGKNSTLVVDAVNKLRLSGKNLQDSIIEGSTSRLRPILMTTVAMSFGMLPLAISVGEGSGIKAPMGITVICGLIFSTILSLFVVPALYKILAPLDDKIRKLIRN